MSRLRSLIGERAGRILFVINSYHLLTADSFKFLVETSRCDLVSLGLNGEASLTDIALHRTASVTERFED